MQEQQARGTSLERKAEIASQVLSLKRTLIAGGEWELRLARQRNPETKALELVGLPLTPERDGRIEPGFIRTVQRAQLERGLLGTGVIDQISQRELGLMRTHSANPVMHLPIKPARTFPEARPGIHISQGPSDNFHFLANTGAEEINTNVLTAALQVTKPEKVSKTLPIFKAGVTLS
jgi:hypothetical protein